MFNDWSNGFPPPPPVASVQKSESGLPIISVQATVLFIVEFLMNTPSFVKFDNEVYPLSPRSSVN